MQLGIVIGNVWATRKEENLTGLKLLIVQPQLPSGQSTGAPFVAVDRIGAGVTDRVIVTRGGAAVKMSPDRPIPIDALIIGIIDSVDVEGGVEFD